MKAKNNAMYSRSLSSYVEIYISGNIGQPENYIDCFNIIRNATETDTIKIFINTYGGSLDTAIQFMRCLQETQAHIIASNEGMCASAGTLIFLSADSFEVSEHSRFMVHNYSVWLSGKGHELHTEVDFCRDWSGNLVKTVYKDFLSTDEIDQVLSDKDIWMDSEELQLRCELLIEAREKLANV